MDNLIKTYDNVLDSQTCKNVIDKFEQFETQHESFDVRGMVFTQLNMAKSPQIWSKEIEQFTSIFESSLLTYLKDTGVTPQQMPNKYIWEPIRLKRYMPNDHDEFKPHVDVDSKPTSTRVLVCFIYLSENEEGQTAFPQLAK